MDAEETRVYHALLIAGFIFFLVFIAFVVTIFNYQKRSVVSYLTKMGANLRVVETEKKRMAADVHDEIGSRLSAIKTLIDRILSDKKIDNVLSDKVQSMFRNLSVSVRQASNSMVPYALQNEGLELALRELILMLFSDSSVQAFLEYKIGDTLLSEESALHIYRIIQELLTNILKHAKAVTVRISLQQQTQIILLVSDNGIGFNEKFVKRSATGVGLRNVSARVKILKGIMYLHTTPGKGTDYRIELPLQ